MEWFASSIGAVFAGYEVVLVTELATNVLTIIRGLSTGIYTTNSPEACHYILENSRANIVVVENQMQMDKILKVTCVCVCVCVHVRACSLCVCSVCMCVRQHSQVGLVIERFQV